MSSILSTITARSIANLHVAFFWERKNEKIRVVL